MSFSRFVRYSWVIACLSLMACGGSNSSSPVDPDTTLSEVIESKQLSGDAAAGRTLPDISNPVAQLGKQLFFTKSLGGDFDSACVSCHHPALGGGDALSLSVGVEAVEPDLVGPGREDQSGLPRVPRNAPTVFNMGLYDASLFHDGRVESINATPGMNGENSDIITPDGAFRTADPNAGPNLVAAQALFPVTSNHEMKGTAFEEFSSRQEVRDHLAARLGDYGIGAGELTRNEWLAAFQTAFASAASAEELVIYENIAFALGEYQRSMVFADNAWKDYVNGNQDALTDSQKRGAVLFFTDTDDGGAGCANCHSGDFFTDEQMHVVAMPQIGPGKRDGISHDDFGRERVTRDPADRYRFRTPTLLNVEVTAPYGHAGSYATLEEVIRHHAAPAETLRDYVANTRWCELEQFAGVTDCESLFGSADYFAEQAIEQLEENRALGVSKLTDVELSDTQVSDIAAFLTALTDPCVEDRECLSPWIVEIGESFPDDHAVQAVDGNGNPL